MPHRSVFGSCWIRVSSRQAVNPKANRTGLSGFPAQCPISDGSLIAEARDSCVGWLIYGEKVNSARGTVIANLWNMKRIAEFVDWLKVTLSLLLFLAFEVAFIYGLYKLISIL